MSLKQTILNTYFKERKKDIATLASTQDVINGIEKINSVYNNKGVDSDEYISADSKFRAFLNTYLEINSYSDLFLIAPAGDIVFTVKHDNDFDTNLLTGPYKDSELANVFRKPHIPLNSETSDFKYYLPSGGPVAFIAVPVFKKGEFLGVVAAQLNKEQIYAFAHDFTGLGKTGETVIAIQQEQNALFVAPHPARIVCLRLGKL